MKCPPRPQWRICELLAGYGDNCGIVARQTGAISRITLGSKTRSVTCVVCYAEIIERFQGLPSYVQNLAATRLFLRKVKPLPLTYPALEQYATIRRTATPDNSSVISIP